MYGCLVRSTGKSAPADQLATSVFLLLPIPIKLPLDFVGDGGALATSSRSVMLMLADRLTVPDLRLVNKAVSIDSRQGIFPDV